MASADQNSALSSTLPGVGPPPSSSATKKKYLGVPPGYTAPTVDGGHGVIPPGADATHQTPQDYGPVGPVNPITGGHSYLPQYTAADEWGPAGDLTQVTTIQAQLVAAGLLKKTDVRPGVWDSASATAYGQVLSFANQQGLTASDALTILTSNPPLGGQLGPKGPGPRVIAFTNPQDVQTQYQGVSQQLTGQEQDPAQFQQQYHDLEAAQAGTNGTNYTQAPSLTDAATQYVQKNLSGQEAAYGAASREQEFLSMVGQ